MAFPSKLISSICLPILLIFAGCTSTKVPNGDRLVSVSWVNKTPGTLRFIQTEVCGDRSAVVLEELPGYNEKMIGVDRELFDHCKVQTKMAAGTGTVSLGTLWLDPPNRKSPEGEYNLRIQILPGLPAQASLEPAHLTRERLK